MKTLIATLIATAFTAIAVVPASAAPVDKDAHRAAMDKAAADYRTAKTKCDAKKGNPEEVCEDEAKLAQARAELDAYTKYDTTGGKLRDARAKVVRAEHELADTQCDATGADAKDRCKATASSIRDAALARLDDRADDGATAVGSSGGGLVASTSTTDPKKAAAVEKCEQMSGDARTACVVDQRGHVTTATGVAATAGARIAENTREAVATVKEKTAAAVDRTKEMASNTARKTENASERSGRVAADSTITTKVKAGLVADPDLKGMNISVDTEQGVVMLGGFVASKAEADKAAKLAKSVDGVTSVKNTIKVK